MIVFFTTRLIYDRAEANSLVNLVLLFFLVPVPGHCLSFTFHSQDKLHVLTNVSLKLLSSSSVLKNYISFLTPSAPNLFENADLNSNIIFLKLSLEGKHSSSTSF